MKMEKWRHVWMNPPDLDEVVWVEGHHHDTGGSLEGVHIAVDTDVEEERFGLVEVHIGIDVAVAGGTLDQVEEHRLAVVAVGKVLLLLTVEDNIAVAAAVVVVVHGRYSGEVD
jgi:hypothetical protein